MSSSIPDPEQDAEALERIRRASIYGNTTYADWVVVGHGLLAGGASLAARWTSESRRQRSGQYTIPPALKR
jgi:hypothetical protein